MADDANTLAPAFPGFPDFRANVTFVPLQFFTVVLPYSTRGCARIVGCMLRQILGWVNSEGHPTREKLQFSYRDLIRHAGVSRETIAPALREAAEKGFIRCVRPPRAARPGQPGQCGIYALNWDEHGPYTDSPEAFRGFYFPEAAVMTLDEAGQPVQRVKAARKNIPNAFFDYLLPREPLSVIRVVGALLFYSIQWGPGGERKVPVSLSITALSRLAKLTRQHVHAAVADAVVQGYITCVDSGQFDPNAGVDSRPATYGVRWTHSPAQPLDSRPVSAVKPERSEKVNGAAVGKGEREQSEKVNGERSEKVNGISIKKDLKTGTTAALYHGEAPPAGSAAAADAPSVEALVEMGFDEPGARYLAGRSSPETIRHQLDWLPLRKAVRNPLGLLRRAIEQNWPKPEPVAEPSQSGDDTAELFARYYYAGYHGNAGEPAAQPFSKDIQAAGCLVARLLEIDADRTRVPQWGRDFGRLVHQKHGCDPRARPFLGPALLLCADEFVCRVRTQAENARHLDRLHAQQARAQQFEREYGDYLRAAEAQYRDELPELYAQFERQRQQSRRAIASGLCQEVPRLLEWFDAEATRLSAFGKFFRRHAEHPVWSFEQWDVRHHRPSMPAMPAGMEAAVR